MSTEGGNKAIIAALGANVGIAITKLFAFALTGMSSMLAEGIHSLADSGNQVLLLVGGKRSKKAPTPEHPFGYGRERYVFGFVVSIVLFSLVVLLAAIVLEGMSFRTAVRESNPLRGDSSWWEFIRKAKAPELPVILLEDFAALIGLVFALFGVSLAVVTESSYWDAAGTALIGLLLVAVAVVLAIETKSLLVGESANPKVTAAIIEAIASADGVDRVVHAKTLHLGPEELLVAVKIAVSEGDTGSQVAAAINAAEKQARAAAPELRLIIYLEPDLDHALEPS